MPRNDAPPASADDLPDALPEDVARTIALNALNHAPKTRKQLAELLTKRGVPDEVATALLDRFTEVKLIDDLEYAQMWVRSRHSSRGLARGVLKRELIQRGVADEHIASALLQVDDDSELLAALELAERKSRAMRELDASTARRRLTGMLMRRGYAFSVAESAVAQVLAEAAG